MGKLHGIRDKASKASKGQGMLEYALIIGIIAMGVISLLLLVPEPIRNILMRITEALGTEP